MKKENSPRPSTGNGCADADPEWLIIAPCGFDLERTTREATTLEALPGWFDLCAVRQGKVALADGNKYFNRSGTTIVETVEILAEILHGYSAGHRGKAWVSYSGLPETVLIRELHTATLARATCPLIPILFSRDTTCSRPIS